MPVIIVTEGVFVIEGVSVIGNGVVVGVTVEVLVGEGVTEGTNNPPDPQPERNISMTKLEMSGIFGFITIPFNQDTYKVSRPNKACDETTVIIS